MQEYKNIMKREKMIERIICNQCGKEIATADKTAQEEWFSAKTSWGYFSNKDGENHSFDLCEECYDKLIRGFVVPVTIEENNELL